LPSLGSRV
jgi:hypothetical protein